VARTHTLAPGTRVRLRLASARDEAPVKALIARTGARYSDLDVARLVRFDPRGQMVVCASELFEGTELVVGFGAIRLDSDRPELLVADERLGDQLAELVCNSLRQLQRARAA
jgi:hypothetical protein